MSPFHRVAIALAAITLLATSVDDAEARNRRCRRAARTTQCCPPAPCSSSCAPTCAPAPCAAVATSTRRQMNSLYTITCIVYSSESLMNGDYAVHCTRSAATLSVACQEARMAAINCFNDPLQCTGCTRNPSNYGGSIVHVDYSDTTCFDFESSLSRSATMCQCKWKCHATVIACDGCIVRHPATHPDRRIARIVATKTAELLATLNHGGVKRTLPTWCCPVWVP